MTRNSPSISEPSAPNQWHVDKKVPLSLIFAMCVQCGIVVWAIADIKKDVEVLKAQYFSQKDRDEQQDKAQARQMLVMTSWMERLDQKLDRLADSNRSRR